MGHPIKHFLTITNHRHKVIANCARAGILWQGLRHDLSKYSPTEFIPGAKFFQGDRSPNEKEREIYGSSRAWMHHKGRNRHHYEYWNDYNPKTKQIENVEMPTRFLIEMFCDRVAASKIYRGAEYAPTHPLEYFLGGKARRRIHPATSDLLEGWLRVVAEQGEDAAYRLIREQLKKGDY